MNTTVSRFPLDLVLPSGPVRVTRAGSDALVFHPLTDDGHGELVRSGPDIPFAPLEITEATTDAQIAAFLVAPPPEPVLTVEQVWANWLAGSITDPVTGIVLKANRQARNDFIGQATILSISLGSGAIMGTTTVSIWDAHNVEYTMTTNECLALLVRYGFAWNQAFNELAP